MAFETLSSGLTLVIPTNGTTNWGTTVRNSTWVKISSHDHTGSGNGSPITTAAIVDGAVTKPKLDPNFALVVASTLTPAGTGQDIDFDNGVIQEVNLGSATGDVTVTLSNSAEGALYTIFLVQGATARDVIWPASVKWPQGQKAILSTANGAVDYVTMLYDGTDHQVLDWNVDLS